MSAAESGNGGGGGFGHSGFGALGAGGGGSPSGPGLFVVDEEARLDGPLLPRINLVGASSSGSLGDVSVRGWAAAAVPGSASASAFSAPAAQAGGGTTATTFHAFTSRFGSMVSVAGRDDAPAPLAPPPRAASSSSPGLAPGAGTGFFT